MHVDNESRFLLPHELVSRISSFLDIESVKNMIAACSGNFNLAECIKNDYLEGNLNYLLFIHNFKCWETRRRNTLTWMKYNDWKAFFHHDYESSPGLSSNRHSKDTAQTIRSHPLFLHECCKPFYDLTASIELGIIEIVQYLISRGHDVNKETMIDNAHFEQCHRPLNAALTSPCPEILRYLLSIKNVELFYPFQSTFGNTIVHFAAGDDRVPKENLSIYLSYLTPTTINSRDSIGKTPLHYACWFLPKDYQDKIEILLRAGANVNAFGNDYQDPLQILIQAGRHRQRNINDTEVLLKQYGAIEIRVGP
mmetsp:Transcript_13956/g.26263  ORF Transcript_13956/g.26263 Transcript_13956/m.26263 type:complete len:309 (+) Transcript_13956:133-1059(+)